MVYSLSPLSSSLGFPITDAFRHYLAHLHGEKSLSPALLSSDISPQSSSTLQMDTMSAVVLSSLCVTMATSGRSE